MTEIISAKEYRERYARPVAHIHEVQPLPEKKGKYGNQKTEYNGQKYDSRKETEYAKKLDIRFADGEILSWQRQVRMPIVVNGKKVCTYVCDFLVVYPDGTLEYIDVKGFRTKEYILKAKLVEAVFGVKIKEV